MRLRDAQLDSLYAQLPPFECKGLCRDSCKTRIACSDLEHERAGPLTQQADGCCSALADGRCTVYEKRPMICRLWGMEESMRCPHGCKPLLSEAQAIKFLRRAIEIGGGNYDFAA